MKLDSEEVNNKFIAYTFMKETDLRKIGKLEEDLVKKLALGANSHPCYVSNTKNMINIYKNMLTTQTTPEIKSNNQGNIRRKNQMKK